jgi:hypothetical protein
MNSEPNRPPGLVAVVVITAVFSILGLLIFGLAIVAVLAGEVPVSQTLPALAGFAISVAEAMVCLGLWKWESWSLQLARVVYALDIIFGIINLFWTDSSGEVVINLVSTGTYIWMYCYVSSTDIRALYAAGPLGSSSKSAEPHVQPFHRFLP